MSAKGRRVVNRAISDIKNQPRNSDADSAISDSIERPYETLGKLANIPRPTTPLRRASSAGPPSSRIHRRTPGLIVRTPAGVSKYGGGSARKPVAVTPHGRAAQRELEARRTPGKDRRRSGRQQRETPRDALRALSRLLAGKTERIVPTPPIPKSAMGKYRVPREDEFDDGPDPERPRLSLPMGDEDDEDDSLLLPPRSAGLEDQEFTVQSVELGRRARSEQPLSRLSRGSFGSVRLSDNFGDLSGLGLGGYGDDSTMGIAGVDDGIYDLSNISGAPGDNTETLRDLGLGRGALTSGRDSDIRPGVLAGEDDTENAFFFTVPPRDASEDQAEEEQEPLLEDHVEGEYAMLPADEEESALEDEIEMEDPFEDVEDEIEAPVLESANNTTRFPDIDASVQDTTMQDFDLGGQAAPRLVKKKKIKLSKHGIEYPSLPAGVVKKLATTFARMGGNSKAKINKETLDAIIQASDWFFEQVSDDLGAYAQHAKRRTIDESDVVTLMARQRQTNASTTPFSLAQKYLPRELLQELRMVPPPKPKKGKQLPAVEEEEEG